MENKIYSINGPVVTIKGKTDLAMMEMVYVGKSRLVGEVIRMNDKETTIQVYEETGGLKAGEPVESTGGPLSVTLGPGILRNIYDGIQRPLPGYRGAIWAALLSAAPTSLLWIPPPSGM